MYPLYQILQYINIKYLQFANKFKMKKIQFIQWINFLKMQ